MILGPIYRTFLPERIRQKTGKIFNDYFEGLYQMKKAKKTLAVAIAWGFVIWIITIVEYSLLAMSLGIDAPLLFLTLVIPIISLLDALPVSFSGIGSRDITLVLFFSYILVTAEHSMAYSLLIFLVNYIALGAAGFLVWLRNPIKIKLS
jgi:uncharacterized protein (TIRG00374 family)